MLVPATRVQHGITPQITARIFTGVKTSHLYNARLTSCAVELSSARTSLFRRKKRACLQDFKASPTRRSSDTDSHDREDISVVQSSRLTKWQQTLYFLINGKMHSLKE